MLERLVVAAALLALFFLAVALGRGWYARRNARIEARLRAAGLADAPDSVTPRIVYFTTKTCVVCKAQQEPALAALQRHAADVRVERHDAIEERELADEYGVLSVPTTAVYDRDGRLVTVNRGFTPAAVLLAQIEGREPRLEGGALMASETLIRAS
jgi:thiol-disulfide isomerase/thioredoxin